MRAFALLLILAAGSAAAAPIEPLRPMAFLAGHCWKGEIPATVSTDEHCFAWILDGRALRDTHTVRTPEKPDYVGETTYYWNPASKQVEYLYLENAGGYSRGTMETTANTLFFPPADHVSDNGSMTYRVRWSAQGDDAYTAWSESRDAKGTWFTMFQMTMKRTR